MVCSSIWNRNICNFCSSDVAKLYQIIYVFIAYNAMMSVYSLINIPYGSMATMMTKDQYQRTLLNIFRQLFAQIASLLVTAGTLPLINFMTEYVGEKKAWSIVYGIFGVIAAILFFLCFAGCKERIHENEETKTEKIRVVDGVKAVLKKQILAHADGDIHLYQYLLSGHQYGKHIL